MITGVKEEEIKMFTQQDEDETKEKKYPHLLEFFLVLTMLCVLTLLLVGIMVVFPLMAAGKVGGPDYDKEIIDYSKWVVTALLAAFGAWIGAGAAYFFGKANLRESSRSTAEALKIVKGFRGLKYIKDINLTAMNTAFLFNFDNTGSEVFKGLNANVGYWFVPVIEGKKGKSEGDGKLKDVIHARVFWSLEKTQKDKMIEAIVNDIEKNKELKKLHGEDFYSKVNLKDPIKDVYDEMKEKNKSVGIVVDDKNRPTHCFTRTDLASLLQMQE